MPAIPSSNFATAADVAARWRPLTEAEQALAEALLADSAAIIRHHFPTIDARIADGSLSAALVELVVVGMVLRVMRDPTGRLQSWTVDDYTERYSEARAGLYIDDAGMALLALPGTSTGAFTIRPSYETPVARSYL